MEDMIEQMEALIIATDIITDKMESEYIDTRELLDDRRDSQEHIYWGTDRRGK